MTKVYRFWVMGILLLGCVGMEFYFQIAHGITVVYTHLFYIPIVVAAFWWGLKAGLPVSLFFALMHIALSFPDIEKFVLLRSLALVFVGSVIGIISDMRRRAEEALRRSRRDFKEIFQAIGQPSIILDPQHRIMSANRAIVKVSGRSEEELIGKKCFEIFHGTDQPPEGCPLEKIRISGQLETAVMEVEALNRSLLVSCTPMLDDSGRPEQVIHIATDMTGLRRAEEEVRESEEKLRSFQENVPISLYATTPEGELLSANPASAELFGYNSMDEFLEVPVSDLYADSKERDKVLKQLKKTGKINDREVLLRKKNGSTFWGSLTVMTSLDESGKPVHFDGLVLDITERKQAETALKESEQFLADLFEGIQDGISVLNTDLTIRHVNGVMKQWYAKKLPLEGRKCYECYQNADKPCDPCPTLRCIESGKTEWNVVPGLPGSPAEWIELFSYPLKDPDSGEVTGVAEFVRNITERKRGEEALQKAHEELELRVKERTDELHAVNEELEAFAYSVAHDLRAPLRTIDGFSHILLEEYSDTLDEEGKYYLERTRTGAQNMAQLIDDILNLSKIGRQSMDKQTINLETIARKAYELLEVEWKGRKVNFAVHRCPPALADPPLMQSVFMNLLSNALKFTQNQTTAEIEIGCETKDEQTVFFVKDNGTGFDMKYVDKLFSPFQRLHRAEEYEGTGIGLAIVQRIIHRHGGQIWVESEVGKGTTFYFTLPA